ncbi:MAG: ExeM/NucH family extracellular endonuclease, partial [Acidobacteriota bacterium]|nr:ExeM/NucH family extracellular endonuclease [Acidobacteriota bacterium]
MRHSLNHFNRFVKTLLAVASRRLSLTALALALCCGSVVYFIVRADSSAQTLPFSQNWTNTGLITTNDDWSGVAGIEGFLGDRAASGTTADIDPQTIVEPLTTIDVIANQTNPNTNTAGGVAEFHTTLQSTPQQTIALQGSGTADHPNIIIYLNTTGQTGINVSYNLRDIDCSVDNAQQQVALQYRVGSSGNFTNLPTGYVADATARVNGAAADVANCTLVTPISVTLPAAADNQPLVQVRIITSNAAGSDEWVGIDDISVTTGPVVDTAPSVMSTSPADNATGVAVASNLSVTFSEAVNAPAGAFSISCAMSGAHTFALSGGPTTFTLNPDTDFSQNEVCTVTVAAAQVTDVDAIDPPDNMAANFVFDFTTINLGSCGSAFTPIYTIQGSGTASPSVGASVTTEGVVVGDFQGANNLKGFYIQDSTGDANTATSDGIYIFDGNAPAVDVAVGDRVRITGTVSESFNNTQINPAASIAVCSTGNTLPAATAVDLPEPVNNDLERYENMLVVFPETLTVTGNFGLGRFGELVLSSDGRLFQQNNFDRTNSAGALATADLNQRRYVVLDDGLSIQNPDPTPYYDANNTRRVGDTTTGLQGVLTFDFSEYRVQPTTAPVFVSGNPRTAAPSPVGGNVKASSFNVLNYFNGDGAGGGFPTSRGATTLAEFNRQRAKIIAAILAINADVYGIIEVENDGNGAASAIQDLVNGLNAATAAGTYAFREGTTPGTDAIKNSIIYKTTTVTPDGAAVNDTDPIFTGQARNPLAQTFTLNSNGQKFVFIVNHFTSKGCSASDTGLDADLGDGQGCDNLQRTLQAEALLDFVEERQTTTGVARVLVMGDLNAYGEEDPIFRLENDASDRLMDGPGGLIDLVQNFVPATDRYSYQFGNYSGYLDHALATKELASFVSGATIWHINADEPTILDYNVEFKSAAQQALNVGTPYRASDHDPVIVGLNLVCTTITVSPLTLPSGVYNLAYNLPLAASGGSGTYTLALQAGSSLPMGLTLSTAGVISGTPTQPGATTFTVIATDTVTGCTGNRTYTISIQCPTISISPATLTQPVVGAAYNQQLTGSGGVGPYTFALAVGSSLPPGLNLVGNAITGVPTASGPFTFTITVTDTGLAAGPTNCSGNRTYTLTVTLPSCAITISPATIPGAFKGTAYSQTFTAMGATGTVMWSVSTGSLPAGLMLSLAGVLSGTPIAAGNFTFTVRASDANNCVTTQSYTLAVHVETAAIADPLACTGPGNLVNVTATVTNNAAIAQAASFTATLQPPLQPNLLAVPGTCVANVGLCSVVSPSIVSWAGTLAARQTVTINYQAQVSDGVLPGTQLCVTSVATVGNSVPATVTACGLANCPVIGPGTLPAATSPVSDQKAGSVLIYNVYTSSTNPIRQNTRISLTNINQTLPAFVHLFFVDGTSCSVADS